MQYDAMRCDTLPCDAIRCDAIHGDPRAPTVLFWAVLGCVALRKIEDENLSMAYLILCLGVKPRCWGDVS